MNWKKKKIEYYRKMICLLYIFFACFAFFSCELLKKEEVEFSTTESYNEEGKTEDAVSSTETSQKATATVQDVGFCYVYICGQVKNPGVYSLEAGKRVNDVVDLAGGFAEDADLNHLNLARQIVDGEQIYVMSKEEAKTSLPEQTTQIVSEGTSSNEQQKININTASKEELMTLSGIGEAKADSIISYRETNGPFTQIEDIKQIEGIKDGVFLKIKDQIIV